MEQRSKQLPQIAVVGSFLEAQLSAVIQIRRKLRRVTLKQPKFIIFPETTTQTTYFTKLLDRRGHLLLGDALILLAFRRRLQTLPRQRSPIEIHENVA